MQAHASAYSPPPSASSPPPAISPPAGVVADAAVDVAACAPGAPAAAPPPPPAGAVGRGSPPSGVATVVGVHGQAYSTSAVQAQMAAAVSQHHLQQQVPFHAPMQPGQPPYVRGAPGYGAPPHSPLGPVAPRPVVFLVLIVRRNAAGFVVDCSVLVVSQGCTLLQCLTTPQAGVGTRNGLPARGPATADRSRPRITSGIAVAVTCWRKRRHASAGRCRHFSHRECRERRDAAAGPFSILYAITRPHISYDVTMFCHGPLPKTDVFGICVPSPS